MYLYIFWNILKVKEKEITPVLSVEYNSVLSMSIWKINNMWVLTNNSLTKHPYSLLIKAVLFFIYCSKGDHHLERVLGTSQQREIKGKYIDNWGSVLRHLSQRGSLTGIGTVWWCSVLLVDMVRRVLKQDFLCDWRAWASWLSDKNYYLPAGQFLFFW